MAQESSTKNNKSQKFIIGLLLLIILLLLWLLLKCRNSQKSQTTQAPAVKTAEASILHGTMTFSSQIGQDLDIEFWVDSPRYRLTWSKPKSGPYLHMISSDGKTLHHHQVEEGEEEALTISYISPKMHQWMFEEPEKYQNLETWEESGLDVKKYTIQQLWSIDGAVQDFYLEDITKYYQDDQLQKVYLRTKGSFPESEEDLIESTYQIESMEYLETVDETLFELPEII